MTIWVTQPFRMSRTSRTFRAVSNLLIVRPLVQAIQRPLCSPADYMCDLERKSKEFCRVPCGIREGSASTIENNAIGDEMDSSDNPPLCIVIYGNLMNS
ncbi:hypothetical protein BJX66DRAFT_316270 [Aspergillus keveii]|uniref:Uncharacterized protein n=1 Tax=Aspergillus keveii TaxID=714993 RepID=A0ABR4FN97_9EURO